jgi:hypothetical protein
MTHSYVICQEGSVAVLSRFFYPTATEHFLTSLSNPLDGLVKVRSTVHHNVYIRTCQVPRNISLFIYLHHLFLICFFFCLQSNKPQPRALLTSNLAANYHSTPKSLVPFALLPPQSPGRHLQHPSL